MLFALGGCCLPSITAGAGFVAGADVREEADGISVTISLTCPAGYRSHRPSTRGDILRIFIEPISVCDGVPAQVAASSERFRPVNADKARLVDIEYQGDTGAEAMLTLTFREPVDFSVLPLPDRTTISVMVFPEPLPGGDADGMAETGARTSRLVTPPATRDTYVINLMSTTTAVAGKDLPELDLGAGLQVFVSKTVIHDEVWHRTRVGWFTSYPDAQVALAGLEDDYPGAWIEHADPETDAPIAGSSTRVSGDAPEVIRRRGAADDAPTVASGPMTEQKLETLMDDGRRALMGGDLSRAIQIYTKVLQYPGHPYLPEAQEYLALARERNGQLAHAKAEYERYLDLYPESEGAQRVRQRLNSLLAVDTGDGPAQSTGSIAARSDEWTVQSFLSQFYRRDANQIGDLSEVVSQSSVFSDLNLDVRRRGERFDFGARLSAGYRHDLMGEDDGPGNETRVSYAWLDLADARTQVGARLGRQSRSTGGVLGRFDGLNLDYRATEKTVLSAVAGKPVNSSSDGIDDERTFYGVSATYGPIAEDLELGVFYIQQDVSGITDREAVGVEFRWFDAERSLWGLIDYDTLYRKVGSYYLHGVWRIDSGFSINGSIDRRMGPFLSTSNALIGQGFLTMEDLLTQFTIEEIRSLALDRTAASSTYTLGVSKALTPKLQLNASFNDASVDGTPESGGVPGTDPTDYQYYSASLVASSLIKEGDVSIADLRYTETSTTKVESIGLDTRFPLRSDLRINPSIRVHRRTILFDSSVEWIYAPRLRFQYLWSRKVRLYLEAGKQFSDRETQDRDFSREYFFANIGYQALFY
jgi:tetratricopeptide (TPR) repeat protein